MKEQEKDSQITDRYKQREIMKERERMSKVITVCNTFFFLPVLFLFYMSTQFD